MGNVAPIWHPSEAITTELRTWHPSGRFAGSGHLESHSGGPQTVNESHPHTRRRGEDAALGLEFSSVEGEAEGRLAEHLRRLAVAGVVVSGDVGDHLEGLAVARCAPPVQPDLEEPGLARGAVRPVAGIGKSELLQSRSRRRP